MTRNNMVEKTVQIRNRAGFHARPAAEFVKLAGRFDSDVRVSKEGLEVNGKSIMGVLMLAAEGDSLFDGIVFAGDEGPFDGEAAVCFLDVVVAGIH